MVRVKRSLCKRPACATKSPVSFSVTPNGTNLTVNVCANCAVDAAMMGGFTVKPLFEDRGEAPG